MMLFAVIFGLSMDYEVFLLSRIREDYDRSHDNAEAVANGLAATARVMTAAAAIMFFVFFSFVLGGERSLKMFGLGLAVAVLLDASIVRMVLVPSTMELLGDRNWWLPRWLDRVLPVVHVEAGEEVEEGPATRPCRRMHRRRSVSRCDLPFSGGQSDGRQARPRLRSAVRRLASSRRSLAPLDGRVGRRVVGTWAASSSMSARRVRAIVRLRHCERDSSARALAESPSRARTRSAPGPSSWPRSATISTADAVTLRCWPPGPEPRANRSSSAAAGSRSPRRVVRSFSAMPSSLHLY
jgi:hypothetical protein